MAPKLKLLYFDFHGMAARIRTAALIGKVSMEDYRFSSRDEFIAMKTSGELPFGQLRGRTRVKRSWCSIQ